MPRESDAVTSRLLLLVASTLVALLVAELGARLLVSEAPLIRFSELAVAAEQEGEADSIANLMVADRELFWRLAPDSEQKDEGGAFRGVVSNARGIRDERDIPFEKPEHELRVLFLGDSTTFGWGLREDETVAYLTEVGLRTRLPGVAVECLNAGVPGYTLYQGWRYLETEGLRYSPDLVVASFGFNDNASWGNRSDLEIAAHQRASRPPAMLAASRFASLIARVSNPLPPSAAAEPRTRLSVEEFDQVLGHLAEATEARGIGLVLLVGGLRINVDGSESMTYRRPLQELQYAFGVRHPFGIPASAGFVDAVALVQALSEEHGVDAVFTDRVHTTKLTNATIAEGLVDRIAPWLFTRVTY